MVRPKLELKFGWSADGSQEKGFTIGKTLKQLERKLLVSRNQFQRISFTTGCKMSTVV